jgi:SsrA-binding protein
MLVKNKKARQKYHILEKFEAGIVLSGKEVKAVKRGSVDLSRSFAKIIDKELFLINASFQAEGVKDSTRSRKLLMKKNQIIAIESKVKAKKLTLVPTKMYTKGRIIKIELALAKHKRGFEKREEIKKRDIEEEIEREIKLKNKGT